MILEVAKVSKSFNGKPVLDEISFSIAKKEVLVLCGPSGVGKTTLIKIIAGLLPFDSGSLRIGDKKPVSADESYPKELFGKIGVIFQDHNLFPHLTALKNVSLALHTVHKHTKKDADDIAMKYLEQVKVADKSGSFPANLSGGEKQRVSLARALALQPYFLLLDEPTSHLDPQLIDGVFDIVEDLAANHGTTMLLSTHNLNFARHIADTFAVLNDGCLTLSKEPVVLDVLEGKWS